MSLFSHGKDNIVSIDIGFRNIKVVEIDLGKNEFIHIKNYGIAPTPRECIRNGHIKNLEKITEVIQRVIDENGIKSKNAKIVMSGTHIASRLMMISYNPNQKPDEAIREFVSKFMPAVTEDTHEIDFKIIDTVSRDGMKYCRVFITAVLKSIIKSYIDVLILLGLKPVTVDIPAYSINKFFKRTIHHNTDPDKKSNIENSDAADSFAVIDFGSETTIVNILRNKTLEFNKAILRGSSNIDEIIARDVFRKLSDAEAIKQKYGLNLPESFTHKEKVAIQDAVLKIINETIEQIYRCFEFYEIKCSGPKISRVYIIGGGSQLNGLKEYLTKMLQIPVFPIGLLSIENISLDKRLNTDKINYLINAAGVALE